MTADLLRTAAQTLREKAEAATPGPFALAVADWLDAEDTHQFGPTEHAIAVARAVLRRES